MQARNAAAMFCLTETAKNDQDVLAVILFGSEARGKASPTSDVDVCLVLGDERFDNLGQSKKRMAYLASFDLDIQVFQQLPLHLRGRVLKEGRVLFCRDEAKLYDIALKTARRFEDFRYIHDRYLEAVASG